MLSYAVKKVVSPGLSCNEVKSCVEVEICKDAVSCIKRTPLFLDYGAALAVRSETKWTITAELKLKEACPGLFPADLVY